MSYETWIILLYVHAVTVIATLLGWNAFYNNKNCRQYQAALYNRLGRLDITPDNFDKDKVIYFAIAFQTTLVCLIPLVNLIVFRTVLKQVNIWNQFQGGNK